MSGLYDTDILIWSERQADLLRRVARGERINDVDLDWPNLIEEIESVGRGDLHRVEGQLLQALIHILKAHAWPDSPYVYGWRGEATRFRAEASRRFAPSMCQRIDLEELYGDAVRSLPELIDGAPPMAVPPTCPMTLDELLSRDG